MAERGGFELPLRIDSMELIEFSKRTKRSTLQKSGFEVRNRNTGFSISFNFRSIVRIDVISYLGVNVRKFLSDYAESIN